MSCYYSRCKKIKVVAGFLFLKVPLEMTVFLQVQYMYLFQRPPEKLKKETVESKVRIMPQSKGRTNLLKIKQNFWSRA